MPSVDEFDYTFDRLAEVIESFIQEVGLEEYSLYVMDYGAPIGFRIAAAHPERLQALIVQNGNAYDEGLREFWDPIKAYWKDRTEANRRRTAKAIDDRRDEMAIHAWSERSRLYQSRYMDG